MDTSQIQSRGSEPLAPPRRFLHCSSCAFWSCYCTTSSSGAKASIGGKKHGGKSLRFVTMWLLFGTETSNSHFLTITFWCIFWGKVFENGQRVSFSNFGVILCFGRNLWFFLPVGVACVLRTSWSFFYKFFYRAANTRVAGHKLRHYAEVVVPSHLHQPLFRESIWPLFFLGATTAVARTFVGIYCPHYFHSKTCYTLHSVLNSQNGLNRKCDTFTGFLLCHGISRELWAALKNLLGGVYRVIVASKI